MKLIDIEDKVIGIIQRELAYPFQKYELEKDIAELAIDSDDWSFIFCPIVEEVFHIRVSLEEWSNVSTVKQVAILIEKLIIEKESRDTRTNEC